MEKISQVPKRLFYVWFGDDIPADVHACIQTWKLAMPDYEIIRIGEEKSEWFNFHEELGKNNWLQAVYNRRLWAYVSDYVRIKVLYDHGGIYFDTDVTATRSFDPLRKHALFMGFQSPEEVNGAVIGSVKHHKFLRSMLTYYEDNHIFNNSRYLLPEIITHILQDEHGLVPFDSRLTPKITELGDIAIYPEEAFYPFRYREKYTDSCLSSNTYSVHWWKASWHSEDDLRWLQIGRLGYFDKEPETIVENIAKITADQKPIKASPLSWLYRVKKRTHGTKYYILGLPMIVVRKPHYGKYVYLFNSIPLFGKTQ